MIKTYFYLCYFSSYSLRRQPCKVWTVGQAGGMRKEWEVHDGTVQEKLQEMLATLHKKKKKLTELFACS